MRVLENYSLLMVSDSPEFLDMVMRLDKEMCDELGITQPQEILGQCAKIHRDRARELMDRLKGVYRVALGDLEDHIDAVPSSTHVTGYGERSSGIIPSLVHESSTDSYESLESFESSYGPGSDEDEEDGRNDIVTTPAISRSISNTDVIVRTR